MPAYVIIKIQTNDAAKLKPYQEIAPKIVDKFDGKMLIRGGEVLSLEGINEGRRIVMIEFETLNKAKEFYHSNEYQKAINLRKDVADFEIIAVDGLNN